jgi:hypothetical protein
MASNSALATQPSTQQCMGDSAARCGDGWSSWRASSVSERGCDEGGDEGCDETCEGGCEGGRDGCSDESESWGLPARVEFVLRRFEPQAQRRQRWPPSMSLSDARRFMALNPDPVETMGKQEARE